MPCSFRPQSQHTVLAPSGIKHTIPFLLEVLRVSCRGGLILRASVLGVVLSVYFPIAVVVSVDCGRSRVDRWARDEYVLLW